LFQTCLIISSLIQTNVKGNVDTILLGRIASSKKKNTQFKARYRCKNYKSFETKMAKIDTLFLTKTTKKNHTYLWGCTYLSRPFKGVPSARRKDVSVAVDR